MIEVTFSDSAGGGLKCVRAYSEELKNSDVVCLDVMADIGNILEPMFGEYRAKLIYKMLYQEQWGRDIEAKFELKRLGNVYAKEYERLKRGLEKGVPVRVWCDGTSASMCGLLWLSDVLSKCSAEVYAVELPKYSIKGKTLTRFTSWGECEPEFFAERLSFSRKMERIELKANAFEWQRLVEENAPLRAVITDRVVSVSASFYDFLIWKYLGDSPIKEAMLIGKILGENQLGVGDCWYAQRIEHFIRKGKIAVVEDNTKKYARIISRV